MMPIRQRRVIGLRKGVTAAVLLGLLLTGGCGSFRRPAPEPPGSAAADIFGDQLAEISGPKAGLAAEQIEPRGVQPAPCPAEGTPPPERATRAVEAAAQMRREGRFTEAVMELERAVRMTPGDRSLLRMLAVVQWEAGNGEAARTCAEQVVSDCADDAACQYILGRLAAARFDKPTALVRYRTALLCSTGPEDQAYRNLAQYHLADLWATDGYLTAALETYESFLRTAGAVESALCANAEWEALMRSTDGAVEERVAGVLERLGRFREAADRLGRVYAKRPMTPEVRRRFIKLLARAGDYQAALEQTRLLLVVDLSAIDLLEAIYRRMNRPDGVLDDLAALAAERPEDREVTLAQARALESRGRLAEATSRLEEAVAAAPGRLELSLSLADLLLRHQQWNAALDVLAGTVRSHPEGAVDAAERVQAVATDREAVAALIAGEERLAPDTADFARAYLLGVLARTADRPDLAEQWLFVSLAGRPDFIPSRAEVGDLLLDEYRWTDAIAVAAPPGVELPADTRLEWVLGMASSGLDRGDEAERHLLHAVRLNPANTRAIRSLAELHRDTGRAPQAQRQWEALVKADPLNESAREQLFGAYLAGDDRRAAAEQIEELRRINARPTRIARCVAMMEFDPRDPDYERFRRLLAESMAAALPDAETHYLIALSYYRQRRFAEALAHLGHARQIDPRNEACLQLLLGCRRADLDFEGVLEVQRTLLARYPRRQALKDAVTESLLILQRYDDALAMIATVLEDPEMDSSIVLQYRALRVRTREQRRDYPRAVDELEALCTAEPKDAGLRRWLIALTQRAGRDERAMALLRDWYRDQAGSAQLDENETLLANLSGTQLDEIIQVILRSIEEEPSNDLRQILLIQALRAGQRWEEAIELARSGVADGRFAAAYQIELYRSYDGAGRLDDAVAVINQLMLDTTPGGLGGGAAVELRGEWMQLLIKSGDYRKARQKLSGWIDDATETDDKLVYLRLLAYCHQESGDYQEAAETLRLALDLRPNDAGLNNDLGYTWADLGVNLDRAMAMLRMAVAAEPRNSAFLDSLGWVLYKQGDFEQAQRWLLLGRGAPDGEDPVICDHLGDVCWRLGHADEAQRWWAEARQMAEKRLAEPIKRRADQEVRSGVARKLEMLRAGGVPEVAATGPRADQGKPSRPPE